MHEHIESELLSDVGFLHLQSDHLSRPQLGLMHLRNRCRRNCLLVDVLEYLFRRPLEFTPDHIQYLIIRDLFGLN